MEDNVMYFGTRKCAYRSGCWQTSIPKVIVDTIRERAGKNIDEFKFRIYYLNNGDILLKPEV